MVSPRVYLLIASLFFVGNIWSAGATTFADLVAAVNSANAKGSATVTVNSNIVLTDRLPKLTDKASLTIVGACKNARKRTIRCVVDGQNLFPFVLSLGRTIGCSLSISNLQFQNIYGGVHSGACSVAAKNCGFANNVKQAGQGSVINVGTIYPYATGSFVRLVNCQFTGNKALNGDGGAIAVGGATTGAYPTVSITGCTFDKNTAKSGAGGAIFIDTNNTVAIVSSTFTSNYAYTSGGAVSATTHRITISRSSFVNNKADLKGSGGAVFIQSKTLGSTTALPTALANICYTSFSGNTNVNQISSKSAPNIFLNDERDFAYGKLYFCPGPVPGGVTNPVGIRRTPTWTWGVSCSKGC